MNVAKGNNQPPMTSVVAGKSYDFKFMFCCCKETKNASGFLTKYFYFQICLVVFAILGGAGSVSNGGGASVAGIIGVILWVGDLLTVCIAKGKIAAYERGQREAGHASINGIAHWMTIVVNIISTLIWGIAFGFFFVIGLLGLFISSNSDDKGIIAKLGIIALILSLPLLPFFLMWLCQLTLACKASDALRELNIGSGARI